jgi:hypothetical protein
MPDLRQGTVDEGITLKKSLIAVPTAVVIGVSTLGMATATSATAAPAQPASGVSVDANISGVQALSKAKKKRLQIRKRALRANIMRKHVKRYNITYRQAGQIRQAKQWARTSKVRSVRQCESGGRYGINTGNGYYGAYQFAAGTWNGVGGGRYTSYAHQAPRFAQDHMAWKLWTQSGWGPWGCA